MTMIITARKTRSVIAMTTSKVNFVNIPQELKNNASFCVWKMEKRQGKPTKVPYNPKTGALARTNDPSTFSDFGTAMKTYAVVGTGSGTVCPRGSARLISTTASVRMVL